MKEIHVNTKEMHDRTSLGGFSFVFHFVCMFCFVFLFLLFCFTWSRGNNTLFMLNSTEHGIYPAHNVKMPTVVGISTFISLIYTTSDSFKARCCLIFHHFTFR